MTFVPTEPQDLPPPSIAVDQIRNNFSIYSTVFDNNHVAMNLNNQGKHSNVVFQQLGTHPTVDNNFDALYSFPVQSNASLSQELFLRIPQFLPNQQINSPIQLTYNSVNTAGPIYQSFMAGGYILYFGSTNNVAVPIVLSPAPTEILCVIANGNGFTTVGTPIPFDAAVQINSNIQFTISSAVASGVYRFSWFAIARQ